MQPSLRPSPDFAVRTLLAALAVLAPARIAAGQDSHPGTRSPEPLPAVERALAVERLRVEAAAAPKASRGPVLERILALDDRDGTVWEDLAATRAETGDLEGAEAALRRAMELGTVPSGDGECRIARLLATTEPDAAAVALDRCLAAGSREAGGPGAAGRWGRLLDDRPDLRGRLGILEPEVCAGARGWLADLDHLLAEVQRLHWVVRRTGLPSASAALADALRNRLTDAGSGAQLSAEVEAATLVDLQRILASLGDGHTVLYPAGQERGILRRLPLGFWWFDDGLVVVAVEEPHRDLLGQRVVALGGLATEDLLERLEPWVSRDNPSGYRWVAPVYLVFEEFVAAAGAVPGELVLEDADGRRTHRRIEGRREPVDPAALVLSLPAPPGVDPPLAWSRPGEAAWIHDLGGGVRYAGLERIDAGLAEWSERLTTPDRTGPVSQLILDLRRNAGGDARFLPPLVRALVAFEAAGGRILVLTSRNTFSAAQTLLNEIEWLTSAVLVGEPPGTRPNRTGNEALVRLPCSGALAAVATGWNQAHSSRDERLWIAPRAPVGATSAAWLAGRDAALEVALRLAAEP